MVMKESKQQNKGQHNGGEKADGMRNVRHNGCIHRIYVRGKIELISFISPSVIKSYCLLIECEYWILAQNDGMIFKKVLTIRKMILLNILNIRGITKSK